MSDPAAWWGEGTYERLAERLAPIHDELLRRLEPESGERWLDVAAGPGAVAIRAAQAGARVSASDLSPAMIERARAAAAVAGVELELGIADARSLPYENASFDVVSSAFGVIFAPEPERVVSELARVCRPGARLGLTTWVPNEELDAVWEPFADGRPVPTEVWGEERSLERLLGDHFDLEVERDSWIVTGRNGAEVWELFASSAPPVRALLGSLPDERRPALRNAFVDLHERYRDERGVRFPMQYLLVLGRRR